MARKKKPLPILENVTIEAVAAEGKALAHVNDMVVFVPFVVPGDVVDLQVRKKRHSYCEAEVIRFIKKSDVRTPVLFDVLAKEGNIPERDMFNTFNMGVGMILTVAAEDADKAIEILKANGEDAYRLGVIGEGSGVQLV